MEVTFEIGGKLPYNQRIHAFDLLAWRVVALGSAARPGEHYSELARTFGDCMRSPIFAAAPISVVVPKGD